MPHYTFEKDSEQYDMELTYDEMLKYLEENPDVSQVFRMNLVDPVGIGVSKPPSEFQKHVLGKIKAANPHSEAVASKRWSIPKEL
jgi:hypothetical protein